MKKIEIADLFCGAGGTSTGSVEAALLCGRKPRLTAINHWPRALETHKLNHPEARHLCTNIDEVNPRELYRMHELDFLWASPECRFHSNARGGRPVNEQQRPTAFCVPRWVEAIRPKYIEVENVPEFVKWGPRKNGETFKAWFNMTCSMGYNGAWKVFCAADYGDPTTRRRLIVQFVRRDCGQVIWPDATHRDPELGQLPPDILPWVPASEIIDWKLRGRWLDEMPGKMQFGGLPLSPKTLARIFAGFEEFSGASFIVPGFGERAGQKPRTHRVDRPLLAVTAHGHSALVQPYILPKEGYYRGNKAGSVKQPLKTVVGDAIALIEAFLVKYYGTGGAHSLRKPIDTITTKDRFALVCPEVVKEGKQARVRFLWRMLQPHELAPGQGFRRNYRFAGNKTEQTKQIGNAVPRRLARALVLARLSGKRDIRTLLRKKGADL